LLAVIVANLVFSPEERVFLGHRAGRFDVAGGIDAVLPLQLCPVARLLHVIDIGVRCRLTGVEAIVVVLPYDLREQWRLELVPDRPGTLKVPGTASFPGWKTTRVDSWTTFVPESGTGPRIHVAMEPALDKGRNVLWPPGE
jgi:hypothetical protein